MRLKQCGVRNKMKFTKENLIQISQKQRKKIVKRTIKEIKNRIKWLARKGNQTYTIEFYEDYTKNEQEIISNYFINRGFETEWVNDDSIIIC